MSVIMTLGTGLLTKMRVLVDLPTGENWRKSKSGDLLPGYEGHLSGELYSDSKMYHAGPSGIDQKDQIIIGCGWFLIISFQFRSLFRWDLIWFNIWTPSSLPFLRGVGNIDWGCALSCFPNLRTWLIPYISMYTGVHTILGSTTIWMISELIDGAQSWSSINKHLRSR